MHTINLGHTESNANMVNFLGGGVNLEIDQTRDSTKCT